MKKAFVLISAAALCAALAGCSSDSAQNNLSKAIDDVERDWDAGVDYMERSMDNMDNTDRNNSGYGAVHGLLSGILYRRSPFQSAWK